ncbi:hypothetical protein K450DRAFT_284822 [Umbelopsis ramanniana AG]|uniref:Arrestin C-terminal-like domain-containing protein n=1 Tax=Umbelopsis ramanniana AG TaxID=1314678 RepID=A0AAD5EIL9_UMBRA|nr:uncharacterized protein K450DRAFT_284822 [Umbelopsis ramanniana AG]KAI8584541.1 hypothetical protein K450DRAFT_284822 [Umbelopsis ramanniana AG]
MSILSSNSCTSSYSDSSKASIGPGESRRIWRTGVLTSLRLSSSPNQTASPRVSPLPQGWKNSPIEHPDPPIQSTMPSTRGIFITTPCAMAGKTIAGRIQVPPKTKLDHHSAQSLILEIIGVEGMAVMEVIDITRRGRQTHRHGFYKQGIDDWTFCQNSLRGKSKPWISFQLSLPDWLQGSYSDNISKVYYVIRGVKQTGRNGHGDLTVIEEEVIVRANIGNLASREKSLYSHLTENNSIDFSKYGEGNVKLQLSIQRRVWASGSPIFCSLQINNETEVTLKDIKLILLRRQNTYSNLSQSFQLMPVSSLCDVVSTTSISSLGWFNGLASGVKENVVLELQTMLQHITVKDHDLIDVSYAIQASIETSKGMGEFSIETLVEVPIILVHPQTVEPPIPVMTSNPATSNITFADLLRQTEDSSESDTDEEAEAFSPRFSIFRQRASFSMLHPTELVPAETVTRSVSLTAPKRRSSATHKVNIMEPAIANFALHESIPENHSMLKRRSPVKRYIVRRASSPQQSTYKRNYARRISVFEDCAEDTKLPIVDRYDLAADPDTVPEIESNLPQSLNAVSSSKDQTRLGTRHKLRSFRDSLRI